jgi:hypothetical protein
MADEQKKIRVACKYPGGILIYKRAFGYDDGTGSGAKMLGGHDGPVQRLNGPPRSHIDPEADGAPFGITEIDADWKFETWWEQNKLNPLVVKKLIFVLDDKNADDPVYDRVEARVPNE